MAQMPRKVTVTVNNKTFQVEPGQYSMRDFAQATGVPTAKQLTATMPTRATVINGNDSLTITGGETFTAA